VNLADYLLQQPTSQIITDEHTYSHSEIVARTNQAAQVFKEAGLLPEERLLLALPDGIDYVAALLGALKVGAAVVMVNPGLPEAEIQDLVHYTRASVAVSSHSLRGLKANVKDLRHDNSNFEAFPSHLDDNALWLFSGGTTGRPKAVLQSHGSFINTTELYAKKFLQYSQHDRTLSVPKLFFGYATGSNLFFPLSVGGSSILFAEKCTPEKLFEQIQRHRPTVLVNVPTLVNQMVHHPQAERQDLSSIRVCTSAGEALPESLYAHWKKTFPGVELLDGLGTAEMWHIFLSNHPHDVRPGSLGKAVPGFEVKIADDDGHELPRGEVGRLWVAGDSRALCYWQRSQESQQALRGRYFASSDLMLQDSDGYFYYCGRADELLKVAGRWLAPQEVESCLLTHPGVKECAVIGQISSDGLTRPHAVVVLQGQVSEEQLKAHVLAHLEPYKHPRSVTFVDQLPRTHLGKVDRGALRKKVCDPPK
jgi:benzoate-CoA ligase family protein